MKVNHACHNHMAHLHCCQLGCRLNHLQEDCNSRLNLLLSDKQPRMHVGLQLKKLYRWWLLSSITYKAVFSLGQQLCAALSY
jgi:hypothetical protein